MFCVAHATLSVSDALTENPLYKVGQEIEVRPGLVSKDSEGKLTCKPIFSRIVSLYAEQNELMYAVPGGLIGNNSIIIVSPWLEFSKPKIF